MGCCGEDDGEDKGEVFEGPNKSRSCTDVICFLVFVAYLFGMIFLLITAVNVGNPYRLLYGYDVAGDICGKKNDRITINGTEIVDSGKDLDGKKYIHFDIESALAIVGGDALKEATKQAEAQNISLVNFTPSDNKITFCLRNFYAEVKRGKRSLKDTSELLNEKDENKILHINEQHLSSSKKYENIKYSSTRNDVIARKLLSTPNVNTSFEDVENEILSNDVVSKALGTDVCRYCVSKCPEKYTPFLFRCVPNFVESTAGSIFTSTGAKTIAEEVIADIELAWKEILYMCLIALGLSLVIMILFRFLAAVIVYVILIIVVVACVVGTIFVWVIWYTKQSSYNETKSNDELLKNATTFLGDSLTTADSKDEVTHYLILAIIVTIVSVILLLIILVLRKRIALVVQLFKEAGKAVQAMPLLILQPLWTFIALVILASCWSYGLAWIVSAGEAQFTKTGFVQYTPDSFLFWMRFYHLFGLLWIANFVIACQHMVISGSVAGWYFSREKSGLHCLVIQSLWRLVRYHLGTVAFGSFIIALIQFIRMIMHYIEKKLKKNGGDNKVIEMCLKACQCCLWCFEKCMQFISRNGYIQVSIHGCNFCSGCYKAFKVLGNNILRVTAINTVGDFVLFLGKLAIVVATIFIGIEIVDLRNSSDGKVHHVWAPVLLASIFAYLTATCFIGVYEMTIDTIFICFCEDCDRNDGINKPYFMSSGLMEFVENSSKALEALKKRKYADKNQIQPQEKDGMGDSTTTIPDIA